ncbi:MAG: alpha-mannosidase [Clostridia bacterium]|nr:alpha-mannosidase [Clostridia bacterium]
MDKNVYLIGSAHLDPIWLWRWQVGCGEVLQTFRSALDRLNEYDDFIFTCSSAAYYKWVEEIAPDMFAEIAARVKEGRWVPVNGWWVQPDCNMPSGESFARQALYSQLYYKEKFGVTCKTGYNVDSFGHSANIPQLLKLGGMDAYVMMRPQPNENADIPDIYMWEGPDGTRVPTFKIQDSYTASGKESIDDRLNTAEKNADKYGIGTMLFYGVGNHGGGPTRGDIEYMKELMSGGAHKVMLFSSPDEYFKDLYPDASSLPVWKDDLQHHASGCYSATSLVKALNRRAENLLFASETFCAIANKKAGMADKAESFKEAWRDVCFNQFHDILCGCSIMEAYDDVRDSFGHALTVSDRNLNEAVLRIARNVDTWVDGVSDPVCEVRNQDSGRFDRPVIVFNPLSFPVEAPVRTYGASKYVKNRAGELVAAQNVRSSRSNDSHLDTVFMAKLPALGYSTYWMKWEGDFKQPEMSALSDVKAEGLTMENAYLKVVFSKDTGFITKLLNKADGFDFASPEKPVAVPTVIDDHKTDTWAHNVFVFHDIKGVMQLESVELVESGPARAVIRTRHVFGESYLVQDFILGSKQKTLRVKCKANWREKFTLLKMSFPMPGEGHGNVYEIPGAFIKRPANGHEEPAGRWGAVSFEANGKTRTLSLLNDGKYSYDCKGSDMRITLLRNVIFADHYSHRPPAEFNFTDEGMQRFEYGVLLSEGQADPGEITKEAAAFNIRPVSVPESFHKGSEPQEKSCISIDKENVALTALKTCEDGSGDLIIRLYETAGKDTEVSISLFSGEISFSASFGHNEIKTFRITNNKDIRETNFLEGLA